MKNGLTSLLTKDWMPSFLSSLFITRSRIFRITSTAAFSPASVNVETRLLGNLDSDWRVFRDHLGDLHRTLDLRFRRYDFLHDRS